VRRVAAPCDRRLVVDSDRPGSSRGRPLSLYLQACIKLAPDSAGFVFQPVLGLGTVSSPFIYEGPVGAEDLIDREEPSTTLLDRLQDGRNSRLEAPRRYGKTSLLLKVLADAEKREMIPVYVNFLGVLTPADVAARIEDAYREQLDSALKRWFTGLLRTLRPTFRAGGPLPVGAEVSPAPPEAGLLDRLSVPRRLHEKHGRSCAIVFDEFQDVLAAGEQIDASIRSELEKHRNAAAYVFSGSQPGMMRELFASRRRGFYAQAGLVEIRPLGPEELAEYIGRRFEQHSRDPGDTLGPLLDLAAGHPQRAMLLAHHVYERTRPRTTADSDTWSKALVAACKQVDGEVQATWRSLPTGQQRLVSVIADGTIGLATREARLRYGLPKSGGHRAGLESLEADGHIVRTAKSPSAQEGTVSGWKLVDPLFALWVRGGRAWPLT